MLRPRPDDYVALNPFDRHPDARRRRLRADRVERDPAVSRTPRAARGPLSDRTPRPRARERAARPVRADRAAGVLQARGGGARLQVRHRLRRGAERPGASRRDRRADRAADRAPGAGAVGRRVRARRLHDRRLRDRAGAVPDDEVRVWICPRIRSSRGSATRCWRVRRSSRRGPSRSRRRRGQATRRTTSQSPATLSLAFARTVSRPAPQLIVSRPELLLVSRASIVSLPAPPPQLVQAASATRQACILRRRRVRRRPACPAAPPEACRCRRRRGHRSAVAGVAAGTAVLTASPAPPKTLSLPKAPRARKRRCAACPQPASRSVWCRTTGHAVVAQHRLAVIFRSTGSTGDPVAERTRVSGADAQAARTIPAGTTNCVPARVEAEDQQ